MRSNWADYVPAQKNSHHTEHREEPLYFVFAMLPRISAWMLKIIVPVLSATPYVPLFIALTLVANPQYVPNSSTEEPDELPAADSA